MDEDTRKNGQELKVFPGILIVPTAQFPKFRVVLVVDGKYQFNHSEWQSFQAAQSRVDELSEYMGFEATIEEIGEEGDR